MSESLAINLFDIERITPLIRKMMLVPNVKYEAINIDSGRPDEVAIAFSCDLTKAACICDTIRNHDRLVKDYPTRTYFRKNDAWTKLAGDAILTRIANGQIRLNPKIFEVKAIPVVPLAPKALQLGKK